MPIYQKILESYCTAVRGNAERCLSGCRQEFVTIDTRGNSTGFLLGFDADDSAEAANIDIAGSGDLLWQCQHKFDGKVGLKLFVGPKIQPTEADVPGFSMFFQGARRVMQAYGEGERHRETP